MMETETQNNTSTFSIKSPFGQEVYKVKESQFKSKWKYLSIQQNQKLLIQLNADVLEEDFPDTLAIFESNSHMVSIPDNFDVEFIEVLVKYFYFREISPAISIFKTFKLLNLAIFFKVQPLINQIEEFLRIQANNKESEAQEIFMLSLDSYVLFQSTKNDIFQNLLSQSMTFLIKSNKIDEALKIFNAEFFKKLENGQIVEKTFNFFIEILKISSSNETLMKFLSLYKDKLIQYFQSEDANFNKEKYFKQFIEKNMNL